MKEIIIRYPDIDYSNQDSVNSLERDSAGNHHHIEILIDGKVITDIKRFSVDVDPTEMIFNYKLEKYCSRD